MKKVLSIMFALAMVLLPLSLVGCGHKGKWYETKFPEQYKFTVRYEYWNASNEKTSDYTYTLIYGKADILNDGVVREVYYLETLNNLTSQTSIDISYTADETHVERYDLPESTAIMKYWYEDDQQWNNNYSMRQSFADNIAATKDKISAPQYMLWDSDIKEETSNYILYKHFDYEILKIAKNQYNYVLQTDGIFTENAYRYTLLDFKENYNLANNLNDIEHRALLPNA